MQNIGNTITEAFVNALNSIILFLPRLIGAIIILLIGWVIAAIFQAITIRLLDWVNLDTWLQKAGIEKRSNRHVWSKALSLIVFWTIIFFFLVPALDSLGIPRITVVLDQLLAYLPNVFAAIVMGILGLILANLSYQVVLDAAGNLGEGGAALLANIAKYAIIIFAALIVLNQLGIASSLIQILFTGIVFMLTLGGGLALGLGGKDAVRDILAQYLSNKHIPTKISQTAFSVASRASSRKK